MIPLATLFSEVDGSYDVDGLPDDAELAVDDLGDHPFLWALDAYVFAGPDAHAATVAYVQMGALGALDFRMYKILDTVDGVMTLSRSL